MGTSGLDRLAASDVVIVVDVLRFSSTSVGRGGGVSFGCHRARRVAERRGCGRARGCPAARRRWSCPGSLRNASAVAAALAEQSRRGRRTSCAVIACGKLVSAEPDAEVRIAVEDLLGAGAVVDALGALGVDHTAPEAAAACESFRGLRGAVRHLLTASGSGQRLIERGARGEVLSASTVDASASVPMLRGGVFVAYA